MKILVTNCKVFNSDKTSLYIEDDKFVNPFEIDDHNHLFQHLMYLHQH